ncbi:hypothetical protein GCM10023188_39850 [Pontibacter saemangeumensis]|uniref:Uncharacterized protein n=1 Tax=Pontibacter saemangeumensis TaxID=1084525 RepID=A0ABP8M111_9BACT
MVESTACADRVRLSRLKPAKLSSAKKDCTFIMIKDNELLTKERIKQKQILSLVEKDVKPLFACHNDIRPAGAPQVGNTEVYACSHAFP